MIGGRPRRCGHVHECRESVCKQRRIYTNNAERASLHSKRVVRNRQAPATQEIFTSNALQPQSPSHLVHQLKQITAQIDHILNWQQNVVERLRAVSVSVRSAVFLHEEHIEASATTAQSPSEILSSRGCSNSDHDMRALQQELKELRSYVLLLPTIMSRDNIEAYNNYESMDANST